jgi:effector protein HopM1
MNFSPLNALRTALYPSGPPIDVERVQPMELGPMGNIRAGQVICSTTPSLSLQQMAELTPIEHAERAMPELKAARREARDLEAQAYRLPLEVVVKRRLVLEGRLLLKNPYLDFYSAGELLDLGEDSSNLMPPRVPYVDITELQTKILTLMNNPQAALPAYQAVRVAFDKRLSDTAKHLEGHGAFFHQTLHGNLSDAEREQIEAGRRALVRLASDYQTAFEQLLKGMLDSINKKLSTAQAMSDSQQAVPPETDEATRRAQHWEALQVHFMELLYNGNPVEKAANRVGLDDQVATLNTARKGWLSQLTTAIAEGVPQGTASMLQFVLARAYVDPHLSVLSLASQSLSNGATLGAVHETLDNFAKPLVRELLAGMGMHEACEVPVADLIHDAARATVVDGRYHERTDDEMVAEQILVEQARAGFLNSQNDFKTGTIKGDMLTFLNQPTAQMIRELLRVTSSLQTDSVAARAITSFGGGMGMSATQALGKLNKTYLHDGRDLPTHVPKAAPRDSLRQRLTKQVTKAGRTIDPRHSETRENYASKIWSASEGMLAYNAIGRAMLLLDITTRSGAASSVALANLQAIGLLLPFYANRQSGDEARADSTSRVNSAIANILKPNRSTLAHGTQPGTIGRQVENAYNRVRGLSQLAPQVVTMLTEAAVGSTIYIGGAINATTHRHPHNISANAPRIGVAPLSRRQQTSADEPGDRSSVASRDET